jgi:hypothetical protein
MQVTDATKTLVARFSVLVFVAKVVDPGTRVAGTYIEIKAGHFRITEFHPRLARRAG